MNALVEETGAADDARLGACEAAYAKVYRALIAMGATSDDAADALQDAFERALAVRGPMISLEGWLFVVALRRWRVEMMNVEDRALAEFFEEELARIPVPPRRLGRPQRRRTRMAAAAIAIGLLLGGSVTTLEANAFAAAHGVDCADPGTKMKCSSARPASSSRSTRPIRIFRPVRLWS